MTTTDETALLKAIADHAGEDLPREMYADWLEENGRDVDCPQCSPPRALPPYPWTCPTCSGSGRVPDERAERAAFIKAQLELSRLSECHHPAADEAAPWCRFCIVRRRAADLWDQAAWGWRGGEPRDWFDTLDPHFRPPADAGLPVVVWARGFPARVLLPLRTFRADGVAARIGRTVGLTAVELTDRNPFVLGHYRSSEIDPTTSCFFQWVDHIERSPPVFLNINDHLLTYELIVRLKAEVPPRRVSEPREGLVNVYFESPAQAGEALGRVALAHCRDTAEVGRE